MENWTSEGTAWEPSRKPIKIQYIPAKYSLQTDTIKQQDRPCSQSKGIHWPSLEIQRSLSTWNAFSPIIALALKQYQAYKVPNVITRIITRARAAPQTHSFLSPRVISVSRPTSLTAVQRAPVSPRSCEISQMSSAADAAQMQIARWKSRRRAAIEDNSICGTFEPFSRAGGGRGLCSAQIAIVRADHLLSGEPRPKIAGCNRVDRDRSGGGGGVQDR